MRNLRHEQDSSAVLCELGEEHLETIAGGAVTATVDKGQCERSVQDGGLGGGFIGITFGDGFGESFGWCVY